MDRPRGNPCRRMRVLIPGALLLTTSALAQPAPADPMAGVFKHRFPNALVSGETYQSEDILEIVPRTPATAYFRLHLEFYNGHVCDLSGIADRDKDRLTYHGPKDADGKACLLSIQRGADGIRISEDQNQACRAQSCGARGGYGNNPKGEPDFKLSERREIRYLPRLLASSEYAAAVAEYDSVHPKP